MKYSIFLVIILFSCSQKNLIVYRKPVKGYVYSEKNLPVNDVSIKYDSLDILSPTNIKTDKKGLFILPKIILKNDLQAKRRISKLSSLIYITKKGYKKTTIDSKKFVKNEAKTNDTIDIGNIYLEKTNEDE